MEIKLPVQNEEQTFNPRFKLQIFLLDDNQENPVLKSVQIACETRIGMEDLYTVLAANIQMLTRNAKKTENSL